MNDVTMQQCNFTTVSEWEELGGEYLGLDVAVYDFVLVAVQESISQLGKVIGRPVQFHIQFKSVNAPPSPVTWINLRKLWNE